LEKDPLTDFVNGDFERKPPNIMPIILMLWAFVLLFLPLGIWMISDAVKPINIMPNAIETDGVITAKNRDFRRRGFDRRTILYWYDTDIPINSDTHSQDKSSTGLQVGRGYKQLVSYKFFRSVNVGDKVTVRYKLGSSASESYVKGATPFWYVIFKFFLGLFFILGGLLSYFIVSNFRR